MIIFQVYAECSRLFQVCSDGAQASHAGAGGRLDVRRLQGRRSQTSTQPRGLHPCCQLHGQISFSLLVSL